MDKEGKKIWVLCSAARAVENEIARASKQPSPGDCPLGSVREFSNLLGGFEEMRRCNSGGKDRVGDNLARSAAA